MVFSFHFLVFSILLYFGNRIAFLFLSEEFTSFELADRIMEAINQSLSRTDSNDRKQDINFKITEEGSKYILAGPVGTFKWNSYYEKKYDDVTLTQDGTTRDDLPERTIETTDEEGNKVIITERDVTS